MWNRAELKTKAKAVLRGSYWKAFLVSIILAFAGGGRSFNVNFNWMSGSRNSYGMHNRDFSQFFGIRNHDFSQFFSARVLIISIIIIFICLLIISLAIAFRVFLGYPLEVGSKRYFVKAEQGEADLNQLGYAFNKARYSDIIKAMLWKGIFNFFWYLLFIIPGIVKSYSYRMVPFILTDNPNINYKRALELSMIMTDGHKWRMFVLDLSFIGWYILGAMALLVGVIFVMPYENATKAELYLSLRETVLNNQMCSYEELGIERTYEP